MNTIEPNTMRPPLQPPGDCSLKELVALARLAREVREAQNRYFKLRSPLNLRIAKDLERRLDNELDRIEQQHKV